MCIIRSHPCISVIDWPLYSRCAVSVVDASWGLHVGQFVWRGIACDLCLFLGGLSSHIGLFMRVDSCCSRAVRLISVAAMRLIFGFIALFCSCALFWWIRVQNWLFHFMSRSVGDVVYVRV